MKTIGRAPRDASQSRKISTAAACIVASLLAAQSLAAGQAPEPQMYAHCINVGQADATLLEFPCGVVLVDAGAQDDETANHLVEYVQKVFRDRPELGNRLAAVYITHPHKDHTFALKRLLQAFRTGHLVENGQDYGSGIANVRWARSIAGQQNISVRTIRNGEVMKNGLGLTDEMIDPLTCEKCDPEVVILSGQWERNPGWPAKEYQNNNNHSLVIRVNFGESSFLFPGDLEQHGIESVLKHYAESGSPDLLDVDVYHVGHHGSHNATTQEWLAVLTPEIAVISVGRWNDGKGTRNPFTTWAYGHPRRVAVDLLGRHITERRNEPIQAKLGTGARRFYPMIVRKRIYATAWDGDTIIRGSWRGRLTVSVNDSN